MFLKVLLRSIFIPGLSYPGQKVHNALTEKIEYSLLFASVYEIRKALSFHTADSEQYQIIRHYGRTALLLDDLLETSTSTKRNDLKLFMKGRKKMDADGDGRVIGLSDSLAFLKPYIQRLPVTYQKKFWSSIDACYDAEIDRTHSLRSRSEKKGGSFILALVYLLDPISISIEMERALYFGGAWAQMIDDYFDSREDKERNIETLFSSVSDPEKELDRLSSFYVKKISSSLKRRDVLIPVLDDMVTWTKRLRFLSPIFHSNV